MSLGWEGVKMNGVEWLWPMWLPKGTTTLLAGPGEAGKGTFAAHLIGCTTNKRPWPDGSVSDPRLAYVVSPDDALDTKQKPLLVHSGVDMALCRRVGPEIIRQGIGAILKDIRDEAHLGIGLIVIDMMQAGMAVGTDGNAAGDVARHLSAFNALAEETHAAVLVVHHVNKWIRTKVAEGTLANLVRGSGAWTDAVRGVWLMAPDENCPDDSRVIVRAKSNIGGVRRAIGGYRISTRVVPYNGENDIPWQTAVVDKVAHVSGNAHDIFAAAVEKDAPPRQAGPQDAAADAIAMHLKPGVPQLKEDVVAALGNQGHARRTVERAAARMVQAKELIAGTNRGRFANASANAGVWELP